MVGHRFAATAGFCAVSVFSPACSDQVSSSADCTTVAVSVTAGTPPIFRWNPACPIAFLTVALPNQGAIVWGTISADQTNAIAPPVQYGVFPTGAAQTANRFEPLVKRSSP